MRFLPAEWDAIFGAIMIAWPHNETDWAPILPEVCETYRTLISKLIEAGEKIVVVAPDASAALNALHDLDHTRLTIAEIPTNDTWTRDYGPITVFVDGQPRLYDFKFNAWGLKFPADKDNLVNSRMANECYFQENSLVNCLDFVLEGGSIESDGKGTLMTTTRCLASLNRNGAMDISQIETYLTDIFGLKQILWLDHGSLEGDDTDSHIDTLARFAPNDTIVYCGAGDDETDPQYSGLRIMATQIAKFTTPEGKPYRMIELPLPLPIYDQNGERLPATYANFLVTRRAVIMPVYGQPANDMRAIQVIQSAYPGRQILTIDCRTLIKQHGSLHCATMQLPRQLFNEK